MSPRSWMPSSSIYVDSSSTSTDKIEKTTPKEAKNEIMTPKTNAQIATSFKKEPTTLNKQNMAPKTPVSTSLQCKSSVRKTNENNPRSTLDNRHKSFVGTIKSKTSREPRRFFTLLMC